MTTTNPDARFQQEPSAAVVRSEPVKETIVGISNGGWVGISILFVVFLALWIWGLVTMAKSGGISTVYFWFALLLFIFVPIFGPIAGVLMSLVAVARLSKPGNKFAGMVSV